MDPISRRRFLEQSLLAAMTGLAATEAVALPRTTRRRVAANDKIHIAIIGVHGRGLDHIKGYLGRDDVEIVALCDADTAVIPKASDLIEKAGKPRPRAVQDIRELLAMKEIDAVSIATPNHWHSLAAIWAMQHGKDVYVEKPISHNVSEGRRTVEVAHKLNRVCQAGTQSRSHKACRDAMDYIHSGKMGKVTLSRGLCFKPRNSIGKVDGPQMPPSSVNYDLWLGPAPQKPVERRQFHYDWHWQWDYGNGDLGNQGIHQMDIARWALNKNTLPNSVMSLGGRFGYVDDGQTPNTEISFFDYGDSHLIFEVRGLKTEGVEGVKIGNIVYGTEGYAAFSDSYGKAAIFDNSHNKIMDFSGGGDHFGNFIEAVHSRKTADLHGEILEGHLSSALCHLGNISYRLGTPQPFNPKTKAFGDDKEAFETFGRFEQHLADNGIKLEETNYLLGPHLKIDPHAEKFRSSSQANALLTREYRKGFEVPEKA
jgi:predicted dehydrogenase